MIYPKNVLPVTTVKRNLMKLLNQVQEEGDPLVITKDGKTAGILMSVEDYEGLTETVTVLRDKKLLKNLQQAEDDFRKRRRFTHHQVFKE